MRGMDSAAATAQFEPMLPQVDHIQHRRWSSMDHKKEGEIQGFDARWKRSVESTHRCLYRPFLRGWRKATEKESGRDLDDIIYIEAIFFFFFISFLSYWVLFPPSSGHHNAPPVANLIISKTSHIQRQQLLFRHQFTSFHFWSFFLFFFFFFLRPYYWYIPTRTHTHHRRPLPNFHLKIISS